MKDSVQIESIEANIKALTHLICDDSVDFKENEHDAKRILEDLNVKVQELKGGEDWIYLNIKRFPGLMYLVKERVRQVEEEGWDAQHDQQHSPETLSRAAATYLLPDKMRDSDVLNLSIWKWIWPFSNKWWKPKDQFQDLVRGAALSLAALDRYLRDKENYDVPGDETE